MLTSPGLKSRRRREAPASASAARGDEVFFSLRCLRFACCAAAVEPKATVMLDTLTKTALKTRPHFSSFPKSFIRRPHDSRRRCRHPPFLTAGSVTEARARRAARPSTLTSDILPANHSVLFTISRKTFPGTNNSRNFSGDPIFKIHNFLCTSIRGECSAADWRG